jgi:hypothetical protein
MSCKAPYLSEPVNPPALESATDCGFVYIVLVIAIHDELELAGSTLEIFEGRSKVPRDRSESAYEPESGLAQGVSLSRGSGTRRFDSSLPTTQHDT